MPAEPILTPIEKVAPGAKAAKDVVDPRGNMLFKAGGELSAQLLERLKGRGVTHVFLESSASSMSPEQIAAEKARLEKEYDAMFENVKDEPLMGALLAAAKAHAFSRIG